MAAIDYYIGAVYLVYHHRRSIEELGELLNGYSESAVEFIRSAAWAFLTAWSLRYGGLYADRISRNTLVDPSL
jgi:hypothetical protein